MLSGKGDDINCSRFGKASNIGSTSTASRPELNFLSDENKLLVDYTIEV